MHVHVCVCSSCTCAHLFVQEVDERFLLVFSDDIVILAVGMSLSGYEMKVFIVQFVILAVSRVRHSSTQLHFLAYHYLGLFPA